MTRFLTGRGPFWRFPLFGMAFCCPFWWCLGFFLRQQNYIESQRKIRDKSSAGSKITHTFGNNKHTGQISIIPKPELRGFWGSSLIKPAFRVTSALVVIICPETHHVSGLYIWPWIKPSDPGGNQYHPIDPTWYHLWRIVSEICRGDKYLQPRVSLVITLRQAGRKKNQPHLVC